MNNHITAVMAMLMLAGAAAAGPAPKPTREQTEALDDYEKIALSRVRGEVVERQVLKYPTGVHYEYLINTKDGRKLSVEIDGKTRKVFAIMENEEPKLEETGEENIE